MQRELTGERASEGKRERIDTIEHQGIIIAFIVVEIGSTRTEERNQPVFEKWYITSRHDCLL
jgi:hypothetical protein